MAKYTVIGIKGYDFKDDEGKQKTGATLYYLDEPLEQGLMRGYIPFTVSVGIDIVKEIKEFPCVCDIEFKRIPNSKGKAIEVFDSLQYIQQTDKFDNSSL